MSDRKSRKRRRLTASAVTLALFGISGASTATGESVKPIDKAACITAAEDGQTLRDAKKLGEARERFLVCSQEACPSIVRDDCVRWLADLETSRPSLVFSAKDPQGNDLSDVSVSIDGNVIVTKLDGSAINVDPGEHTLRFEGAGRVVEKKIVVAEGEKWRPVEITLGDEPKPIDGVEPDKDSGVWAPPWIAFGIGAAGLVTFAALQGVAQAEYADLEDGCGATRSCTDDDIGSTETKFIASGVMLGVGSAALATAIVLWIVDAVQTKPEKPNVTFDLGPDRAFLSITVPL